jgi:hypothetical protein
MRKKLRTNGARPKTVPPDAKTRKSALQKRGTKAEAAFDFVAIEAQALLAMIDYRPAAIVPCGGVADVICAPRNNDLLESVHGGIGREGVSDAR